MRVRYHGSPYHKRYPSRWGGASWNVRSDKTECPLEIGEEEVIRVLEPAIQAAIQAGHCSLLRDGDTPRYAWGRSVLTGADGGTKSIEWEARVENHGIPEYKAYPVTRGRHSDHMPPEVEELLWPD